MTAKVKCGAADEDGQAALPVDAAAFCRCIVSREGEKCGKYGEGIQ